MFLTSTHHPSISCPPSHTPHIICLLHVLPALPITSALFTFIHYPSLSTIHLYLSMWSHDLSIISLSSDIPIFTSVYLLHEFTSSVHSISPSSIPDYLCTLKCWHYPLQIPWQAIHRVQFLGLFGRWRLSCMYEDQTKQIQILLSCGRLPITQVYQRKKKRGAAFKASIDQVPTDQGEDHLTAGIVTTI